MHEMGVVVAVEPRVRDRQDTSGTLIHWCR